MPDVWTEVNLFPTSVDDRSNVLLNVIDPLVHVTLNGDVDSWHYGQYGDANTPFHLRLRVLWRESARADEGRGTMRDYLRDKKDKGILVDFYEGSHGEKGKVYPGEDDEIGEEVWNVTYKLWESQSEYALALVKHESANSLSKHDPPWHWVKSVHLLSNRMLFSYPDEAYLSLQRARAYLPATDDASEAIKQTQQQMGRARIATGSQARPLLTESVQKMFDDEFGQA